MFDFSWNKYLAEAVVPVTTMEQMPRVQASERKPRVLPINVTTSEGQLRQDLLANRIQ
jgi:hypothetical protein